MNHKKKNICMVATNYALLLYLLSMDDEDIKRTFFILTSAIPQDTGRNIINQYRIPKVKIKNNYLQVLLYKYLFSKLKLHDYNSIFAQDHNIPMMSFLHNKKYTLIEDSANVCSNFYNSELGKNYMDQSSGTIKSHIFKLLLGDLYFGVFGRNSHAKGILLTKDDEIQYLKTKMKHFVPEISHNLWLSFSEWKKQFIIKTFNVDILKISKIPTDCILLLTQPLTEFISKEEQISIYKKIINNYNNTKIVIKSHPRDIYVEYEKLFPNSIVIRETFPSEFFKLMGINIGRVVTAFSTAVNPYIGKVPVDWYGCKVSPQIVKMIGEWSAPDGVNIIK